MTKLWLDQPYFTKENISGTMVGVWAPKHLTDLFGLGFHLHFVSDDKLLPHMSKISLQKILRLKLVK